MSQIRFTFNSYEVLTGWDRRLQEVFLTVWKDGQIVTDSMLESLAVDDLKDIFARFMRLGIEWPRELPEEFLRHIGENVGNEVKDYGEVAPWMKRYKTYTVEVMMATYDHGDRPAILLVDPLSHEGIATASVNLPDFPIGPHQVFVKDWSENEGMLVWLVENGIVRDTGEVVPTGYVLANLCELTPDYVTLWEKSKKHG
jgi:hypothetical protein